MITNWYSMKCIKNRHICTYHDDIWRLMDSELFDFIWTRIISRDPIIRYLERICYYDGKLK